MAALIMMAGIVTLVACNKEVGFINAEDGQSSILATKGEMTTFSKLHSDMIEYYEACDNAFLKDSISFIKACEDNDTVMFLKLTGISDSLLNTICNLAKQEAEEFAVNNLNFKPLEEYCKECSKKALPRIGKIVTLTHGNTASLAKLPIEGNNRVYLEYCIRKCEMMTTPCEMSACISACMGEHLVSPDGWYARSYTKEDGTECLEEYLIVNFEVKAKKTNNEPDDKTSFNTPYVRFYESDAYALVDILAEQYDCIYMVRTEHSAADGIFGRPYVDWVIYYGNMDENGDCIW